MVEWTHLPGLAPYAETLAAMEARAAAIAEGTAPEAIWLLEHPPLYTAGTSAKPADLVAPDRFPVFEVGRGGQYTYHGPGQRVAYVMLDLKRRGGDVRARAPLYADDWAAVPAELRKWVRGGGRILRGLVLRREAEVDLCQR